MMERKIIGVEYEESQGHIHTRRGDVRTYFTIQEEGKVFFRVSNWATDISVQFETTFEKLYEFMRAENEMDVEMI